MQSPLRDSRQLHRLQTFQGSVDKLPGTGNDELIKHELRRQRVLRDELSAFQKMNPEHLLIEEVGHEAGRKLTENEKILDYFGNITVLQNLISSVSEVAVSKAVELRNCPTNFLSISKREIGDRIRSSWEWVHQLGRLSQLHVLSAAEYHQFFSSVTEVEQDLTSFAKELTTRLREMRQCPTGLDEREKSIATILSLAQNKLKDSLTMAKLLTGRSLDIVPVNKRIEYIQTTLRGVMLADYETVNGWLKYGDEVEILDNSLREMWQVRATGVDCDVMVPSICVWVPPVCEEAVQETAKLKEGLAERWSDLLLSIRKVVVNFLKDALHDIVHKNETVEVTNPGEINDFMQRIEIYLLKDVKDPEDLQLRVLLQNLRQRLTFAPSRESRHFYLSTSHILILEGILGRLVDLFNDWMVLTEDIQPVDHPELGVLCDYHNVLPFDVDSSLIHMRTLQADERNHLESLVKELRSRQSRQRKSRQEYSESMLRDSGHYDADEPLSDQESPMRISNGDVFSPSVAVRVLSDRRAGYSDARFVPLSRDTGHLPPDSGSQMSLKSGSMSLSCFQEEEEGRQRQIQDACVDTTDLLKSCHVDRESNTTSKSHSPLKAIHSVRKNGWTQTESLDALLANVISAHKEKTDGDWNEKPSHRTRSGTSPSTVTFPTYSPKERDDKRSRASDEMFSSPKTFSPQTLIPDATESSLFGVSRPSAFKSRSSALPKFKGQGLATGADQDVSSTRRRGSPKRYDEMGMDTSPVKSMTKYSGDGPTDDKESKRRSQETDPRSRYDATSPSKRKSTKSGQPLENGDQGEDGVTSVKRRPLHAKNLKGPGTDDHEEFDISPSKTKPVYSDMFEEFDDDPVVALNVRAVHTGLPMSTETATISPTLKKPLYSGTPRSSYGEIDEDVITGVKAKPVRAGLSRSHNDDVSADDAASNAPMEYDDTENFALASSSMAPKRLMNGVKCLNAASQTQISFQTWNSYCQTDEARVDEHSTQIEQISTCSVRVQYPNLMGGPLHKGIQQIPDVRTKELEAHAFGDNCRTQVGCSMGQLENSAVQAELEIAVKAVQTAIYSLHNESLQFDADALLEKVSYGTQEEVDLWDFTGQIGYGLYTTEDVSSHNVPDTNNVEIQETPRLSNIISSYKHDTKDSSATMDYSIADVATQEIPLMAGVESCYKHLTKDSGDTSDYPSADIDTQISPEVNVVQSCYKLEACDSGDAAAFTQEDVETQEVPNIRCVESCFRLNTSDMAATIEALVADVDTQNVPDTECFESYFYPETSDAENTTISSINDVELQQTPDVMSVECLNKPDMVPVELSHVPETSSSEADCHVDTCDTGADCVKMEQNDAETQNIPNMKTVDSHFKIETSSVVIAGQCMSQNAVETQQTPETESVELEFKVECDDFAGESLSSCLFNTDVETQQGTEVTTVDSFFRIETSDGIMLTSGSSSMFSNDVEVQQALDVKTVDSCFRVEQADGIVAAASSSLFNNEVDTQQVPDINTVESCFKLDTSSVFAVTQTDYKTVESCYKVPTSSLMVVAQAETE